MGSILQEQYSSFKQKFEHLDQELAKQDEERRAQADKDIEGIGAEILKEAKAMFEHGQKENGSSKAPGQIEIERSDADRKRVKETFFEVCFASFTFLGVLISFWRMTLIFLTWLLTHS